MTELYSTLAAIVVTATMAAAFVGRIIRRITERTACGLYALAATAAAVQGYLAHAWPWNIAAALSAVVLVVSFLTFPRRAKEPQQ